MAGPGARKQEAGPTRGGCPGETRKGPLALCQPPGRGDSLRAARASSGRAPPRATPRLWASASVAAPALGVYQHPLADFVSGLIPNSVLGFGAAPLSRASVSSSAARGQESPPPAPPELLTVLPGLSKAAEPRTAVWHIEQSSGLPASLGLCVTAGFLGMLSPGGPKATFVASVTLSNRVELTLVPKSRGLHWGKQRTLLGSGQSHKGSTTLPSVCRGLSVLPIIQSLNWREFLIPLPLEPLRASPS